MKNIFVYVGSKKGEKSNTLNYLNLILGELKQLGEEEVRVDIFHPCNSNIDGCAGCKNCFIYGICPLDENDDMKYLKAKMKNADFLILATPVYAANVSSFMKTFLDRISYWMHLMRLSGKPGMVLVTSSGNGGKFTLNYLNNICYFLGIDLVEKLNINTNKFLGAKNENFSKQKLSSNAKLIYDYLIGLRKVKSSENLEIIFSNLKRLMKLYESNPNYEYNYWKKNKMLTSKKFHDLLTKVNEINDQLQYLF